VSVARVRVHRALPVGDYLPSISAISAVVRRNSIAPMMPSTCLELRRADDCAGDGGIVQRPGNGDFAGGTAVPRADGAEAFDELEVLAEFGFLKFRGCGRANLPWAARATRSRVSVPVSRPEAIGE